MVGATYMVLKACRGCLTTTGKLERVTDLTRRVFFTICGLQVTPNDGLPQYLCIECSMSLRKTLAFRRKTRRAYFALNEIKKQYQVTNKEITTKDVCRINRVATNLVSSHGLWKPDNTALYSINVEPDVENLDPDTAAKVEKAKQESLEFLKFNQEDKEKKDIKEHNGLTKEAPLIEKNVSIIVDIKPANYKELERQKEEEEALREIREEESHFDDVDNADDGGIDPATIDMNDIFKDLEEKEKEDSDDGLSDVFHKAIVIPAKAIVTPKPNISHLPKRKALCKSDSDLTAFMVVHQMSRDCLGMTKIRYMSAREQIEAFKKRGKRPDYVASQFRCSMCVITVPDRARLIKHSLEMHKHNKACCDICKAGFADETDLEVHKAWQHWYEYTCVCGELYYTFVDLTKCIKKHPLFEDYLTKEQREQLYKEQEERVEKHFDKTLIAPQNWHKTNTAVFNTRVICSQCGDTFRSVKLLQEHKKEEIIKKCEYMNPECHVCQRHFNTKEALRNHFEKSHTYMYKCKRCPYKSYRNEALSHSCTEFTRYRAGRGPIEPSSHHCVECAQYFTSRAALLAHQLEKHCMIKISTPELTPSEFYCGLCHLRFAYESALNYHKLYAKHMTYYKLKKINTIKEPEEKRISLKFPVKCSHCDQVFYKQISLNTHVNKKHPETVFRHPEHIKRHPKTIIRHPKTIKIRQETTKEHPETNIEMAVCESCGAMTSQQYFNAHKQRCSQAGNRKRCTICSHTFSRSWELIAHTLRCHIVRPFACGRCFLRFRLKNKCKTHILKIHAPQKLYSCNMCNIEFSCSQYCRQHMRRVHKVRMPKTKESWERRSAVRRNLICYPDMRFVMTDIPMSIIEDCKLLLSDYADEKLTPIPKDQIKDYFIFNLDTDVVPDNRRKRQPPCIKKQTTQENVKNDEYVISYVQKQDGGFIKKEEAEQNVEQLLSEQDNMLDISRATDQDGGHIQTKKTVKKTKQQNNVKKEKEVKELQWVSKIEPKWDDSIAEGLDMPMLIDGNAKLQQEADEKGIFTQKSEIIEENPPENDFQDEVVDDQTNLEESQCPEIGTEENPLRMEIDADELIRKYGIVVLDGVQYANIDGTLYKVEYS